MNKEERSLEEWIEFYNRKVFDPFERDEKYHFLYRPDKGFAEVAVTDEMAFVNQVCGDIHFWKALAEGIARANGLKVIGTRFFRDNVKAYIRLNGYEVYKTEDTPDGVKYFGINKKTGKKGEAVPAFVVSSGKKVYHIFFEV